MLRLHEVLYTMPTQNEDMQKTPVKYIYLWKNMKNFYFSTDKCIFSAKNASNETKNL